VPAETTPQGNTVLNIDAMGTPTEIAKKIVDKGGDYVFCLKANHPRAAADGDQSTQSGNLN
jgi:hypothetical protein